MPLARSGRRKLGPRRAFGLVSMMLAGMSTCRVAVLYLESVSAVRADRQADLELLDLCASGHARGSPKMREACLKAQADRAAPIVMKALMRACSIAWREFLDNTGSPFKLFLVVLCVLSALVLPVMPMLRVLFGLVADASIKANASDSDSDDEDLAQHFIEMHGGVPSGMHRRGSGGLRRRLRALWPQVRRLALDERRIEELERQKHTSAPRMLPAPPGVWADVSLGHEHQD
jgi:hypothetical protein